MLPPTSNKRISSPGEKGRPAAWRAVLLCVLVERIAGGSDGANQVRPAARVERLSQAPHVHIDGPRVDIGIVTPHGVEQPLAGKDPSRVLEKMPEQAELGRTK